MSVEYENEPIPGLPGIPPKGERILWQGSPDWRVLARTAFHTRLVTGYFVLLTGWAAGGAVCRDWEEASRGAEALGMRVVLLRTGIVLARDGGALAELEKPIRAFVGAPLGNGRNWFPWIHRDDLVAMIGFALEPAGV